jgi:predicted RNase H-like HicB family nuclease
VRAGFPVRRLRSLLKKSLYLINDYTSLMFAEYIQAAMDKATYEIIDDPEPFYGEVSELKGLWATGKTLEECRKNLMDALEDWIAAHLAWGYPVPPLEGLMIQVSKEPMVVAD